MPGQVDLSGMPLPDATFVVRSVPHDWLFPQVSAVIHHGGIGTMATAPATNASGAVGPMRAASSAGSASDSTKAETAKLSRR